jgi:hypothetical protein
MKVRKSSHRLRSCIIKAMTTKKVQQETDGQRSDRIIQELKTKYPHAKSFDLDGRGSHFVCEVEPTYDHPEYDRAIEVIISQPAS